MAFGWLKPKWLLERKAARLLARMELDPSPANKEALERWRNDHPRNADALRAGARVLRDSVNLPGSQIAEGDAQHQAGSRTSPDRRRTRVASMAIAVLAICMLFVVMRSNLLGQRAEAMTLTTSAGEFREFPLSDGTRVMLNPATAVRVEIDHSHRQARVERGRARFTVAGQSVPFLIRGPSVAVRINEGIIEVSSTPAAGIQLVKGTAQVTSPNTLQPVTVHAPATLNGTGNQIPTAVRSPEADRTTRRLNFDQTRLQDAVAAANRHSPTQIIIQDPAVAELKVTGVFKANDAEGLAKALASAFGLRVTRDAQGELLLTSPGQ